MQMKTARITTGGSEGFVRLRSLGGGGAGKALVSWLVLGIGLWLFFLEYFREVWQHRLARCLLDGRHPEKENGHAHRDTFYHDPYFHGVTPMG